MRTLIFFLAFLSLSLASAQQTVTEMAPAYHEYFELGLSGNYRKTHLDEDNSTDRAYDENSAWIGSIAYYFREMTAVELSYSQGKDKRYIPSSTITSTTTHNYDMWGADLVFTFGQRTDTFIPYIKGGIAYFSRKSIDYEYVDNTSGVVTAAPVEMDDTVVPSAGVGMQLRLTQRFAFKVGVDVWTSGPIDKKVGDLDWAGRFGFSWFL